MGTPRARKKKRQNKRGKRGEKREDSEVRKKKAWCKEEEGEREGDLTEREHKVTERSNRHSGFDIPSASD